MATLIEKNLLLLNIERDREKTKYLFSKQKIKCYLLKLLNKNICFYLK